VGDPRRPGEWRVVADIELDGVAVERATTEFS
jgi:hypothetical protein